jgi:peptidoglycan/xylan/chitin deacetylase (PgdA/CDA1 family)
VNALLSSAIATTLTRTGAMAILENYATRGRTFILALHRVLPEAEMDTCYNPYLAITPASLADALVALRQLGTIVSLDEAIGRVSAGLTSTVPAFAITFDDGWEDNHRLALPILLTLKVPATIFLATEFIGTSALLPEERFHRIWHTAGANGRLKEVMHAVDDGAKIVQRNGTYEEFHARLKDIPFARKNALISELEHALSIPASAKKKFMTWDEVRAMSAAGVRFGSHTASHCVLPVEPEAFAAAQLRGSKATIETELRMPVNHLAYPNGRFSKQTMALAHSLGFTSAVTTVPTDVRGSDDVFALPRIPLDNFVVNDAKGRFSPARLRLHLVRAALGSGGGSDY